MNPQSGMLVKGRRLCPRPFLLSKHHAKKRENLYQIKLNITDKQKIRLLGEQIH